MEAMLEYFRFSEPLRAYLKKSSSLGKSSGKFAGGLLVSYVQGDQRPDTLLQGDATHCEQINILLVFDLVKHDTAV
jgi:hypothetical protein